MGDFQFVSTNSKSTNNDSTSKSRKKNKEQVELVMNDGTDGNWKTDIKVGSIIVKFDHKVDVNNLSEDDLDFIAAKLFFFGLLFIPRILRLFGFHPLGLKSVISDNNVVDISLLPSTWVLLSILFKATFILALFVYFFSDIYTRGITQPFVSLDKTAGECEEIPQSLNGIYKVDVRGNWETSQDFQYQLNNFFVSLRGLSYTSAKWKEIMKIVETNVIAMGKKTSTRDLSYNIIALASYAAFYNSKESGLGLTSSQGNLYFYSSAEPSILFDGYPSQATWVSDRGTCVNKDSIPDCTDCVTNSLEYDQLTATLQLSVAYSRNDTRPCVGILYPKMLGFSDDDNYLSMDIDMNSVSTALAVNMGIRKVSHLVKVPGDQDRVQLIQNMYRLSRISYATMKATSSYFDDILAPMEPIYCTTFTGLRKTGTSVTGNATQCGIRIGNTIAYPIINHRGYETTYDYAREAYNYKKCSAAALKLTGFYAKVECNLNSLMLTLVMYGDDYSPTEYFRSKTPTFRPTPSANQPTLSPTLTPTQRPSLHSSKPSKVPSASPSFSTNDDLSYPFYSGTESTDTDDCNFADCSSTRDDDYQRGEVDDVFIRSNYHRDQSIDSGDIFTYMRWVAQNYYNNTANQGDTFISRTAWEFQNLAMGTLYKEFPPRLDVFFGNNSFSTLCGPIKANCTTVTFTINNGAAKKSNKYLYTPSSKLAYTDVFYGKNGKKYFNKLYTPPSSLIQFYYSCVMTTQDSVFNALGIAKGNVDVLLGIAFYFFCFIAVVWLNRVRRVQPQIKPLSHSFAEEEVEEIVKENTEDNSADINGIKDDILSLKKLKSELQKLKDEVSQMKKGLALGGQSSAPEVTKEKDKSFPSNKKEDSRGAPTAVASLDRPAAAAAESIPAPAPASSLGFFGLGFGSVEPTPTLYIPAKPAPVANEMPPKGVPSDVPKKSKKRDASSPTPKERTLAAPQEKKEEVKIDLSKYTFY